MSNRLFAGIGIASIVGLVLIGIFWGLIWAAIATFAVMNMLAHGITWWPLFAAILSGSILLGSGRAVTKTN